MHFHFPPHHLALAVVDTLVDVLKARGRSPVSTLVAMLHVSPSILLGPIN